MTAGPLPFRTLFELAPDAVWLMEKAHRFVDCNQAAVTMLGFEDKQALLDTHPSQISPAKQPDGEDSFAKAERMIAHALEHGIHRFEWTHLRADGTSFPAEITLSMLELRGQPVLYCVGRDITERKATEARVAQQQVELRAINQMLVQRIKELDEFTYVASHDLQEPLRKLVSFSELLPSDLPGELPARAAKDLGYIIDAGRRMQRLIQDLLSMSRIGRREMDTTVVPLDECLRNALDDLELKVRETGAAFQADPLPALSGDRSMLERLFLNLLGNALKFSRPGVSPRIHVRASRQGEAWRIDVADNGLGIDPKYFEQIFAPFKRLHGRTEFEGTGIGLAICRKIVERHGGTIWVESEPGEGTTFCFTLPTAVTA